MLVLICVIKCEEINYWRLHTILIGYFFIELMNTVDVYGSEARAQYE